jgi:small subunit ribosomal protein S6
LRRYETILIAHVDLSEDELSSLITRHSAIVTDQKGILVKVERWGKRRLAYMIKKQARGFYILIDYAGETAVVNELERNLKINDKILKFMTVLKDDAVDPAALEKEITEAAQKTEKKEEVIKVASPAIPPSAEAPAESPAPTPAETPQPAPEEVKTEAKGDN